jgi:CID domain
MNATKLEQRLLRIDGTQDSISTLSQYCRAYESEATSVCSSWLKIIQSAAKDQALPLLYLANDILQRSKATPAFASAFEQCLEDAMRLAVIKAPECLPQIKRLPTIWAERNVLPQAFCMSLLKAIDDAASGGDAISPRGSSSSSAAAAVSAAASQAQEDAAMAYISSLPPKQAFAEALRRAELVQKAVNAADDIDPLALQKELSHLEAALAASKDGGLCLPNSASTSALEAAESLLKQAQEAERILRLANSALKLNSHRRNGFIGKLTECLSVAAERSSTLEAEITKYKAVEEQVSSLSSASAAGQTLYKPGKAAMSLPALAAFSASGSSSGSAAGDDNFLADAYWPSGSEGAAENGRHHHKHHSGAGSLEHDAEVGAKLLEAYADDDGTGNKLAAVVAEEERKEAKETAKLIKRKSFESDKSSGSAGVSGQAPSAKRRKIEEDADETNGGNAGEKKGKKKAATTKASKGGNGLEELFDANDSFSGSSSSDSSSDSASDDEASAQADEGGKQRGGASSSSGAGGNTNILGAAAKASADAPMDIQSLIGPGKRFDALLGAWVDESDENVGHGGAGGLAPRDEDAWR